MGEVAKPTALVDTGLIAAAAIRDSLSDRGWHATIDHVALTESLWRMPPDLLVSLAETATPRSAALRGTIIVSVGGPGPGGADVEADVSDAIETVVAAADGAWPAALGEDSRRLIDVYGAAAIAPMLTRFADLLDEALAALDSPGAPATAHRVAGVAGTLGFGALGRQWLALSEGHGVDMAALRIASRHAIATLSCEVPRLTD